MTNKKRICLFAGFNRSGILSDYVLYYLRELSKIAEVHYCSDCSLQADNAAMLSSICKTARGEKHGKYDFGSWQKLITELGYGYLSGFDELILANDSVFGPFWDISPYFDVAANDKNCDFWGFTCHNHNKRQYLNSFFTVFKKKTFTSNIFKDIFAGISIEQDYYDIVKKYEVPLTLRLQDAGFIPRTVIPFCKEDMRYEWKRYFNAGLPFIKIRNFTDGAYMPRDTVYDFEKYLTDIKSAYPAKLITGHLKTLKTDAFSPESVKKQKKLFGKYRRRKMKHRLLRIHFNKGDKILTLFGFNIIDNTVLFKTSIEPLNFKEIQ